MKLSLNDIKKIVSLYANKIQAPLQLLLTYGNWKECHPNVEVDKNGQLYLEVYERGQQIRNDFALDEDDLCYRIFSGITFEMALQYELKNRIAEQDFRRILFAKQEELLALLNEKWKEREHREHQSILKHHPFDDNTNLRLDYLAKLKDEGISHQNAIEEAEKKFPKTIKDI